MTELMTGKDDEALLRELRQGGDRGVLEELVRRHVDFVYSAAKRQVGGDAHLAEDVTQGVFVLLGRKRPAVAGGKLAGWLFNTTRFVARNAVKMERRRRKHERAAAGMRAEIAGEDARWEDVGPVLDGAVAKLGRGERDVVLLHYFQNMTLGEVARKLGISEVAARQRSSRAVGKLREMLAKQGVACSAVGLAEGMRAYAVTHAPEGMVAKAGATTGGGVAVASSAAGAMTALKVKVAAAVVGAAVVVAGGVVMVERRVAPANPSGLVVPAADLSNFKTCHLVMTVSHAGTLSWTQELAVDNQRGVVGVRRFGAEAYVETFDGTAGYRFREGGNLAVKVTRSSLNLPDVRRMVGDLGSWSTATPVRTRADDVVENGEAWQAYGVTRWRVTDGLPTTVWVDAKGVLRRARATGSSAAGKEVREFNIDFDRPLTVAVPAELPKGARVVGEEQLAEELYPLKGALATAEAASHVLAVHSAVRDADGRYHLVVSVRPNGAARPLVMGLPPVNFVVRTDKEFVSAAIVTARQECAGLSVRDLVIVPGSKMKQGVCEFDMTMLPWGEVSAVLQQNRLPISGMAHMALKVDGRAGALETLAAETFDRVAALAGAVGGGVSLETEGTMPLTVPPAQVGREQFVAAVVKRVKG